MFRSKLSDLLVSAGLSLMPKPAPLPRALGLLGFASVAIWLYGLVKVTDRDRAQLHLTTERADKLNEHYSLFITEMRGRLGTIDAFLAEPNMGETFGAFKARCPGAKLTRGIWPVSDDATWDGSIFIREEEEDRCPMSPCGQRIDPYGLGRSLAAARAALGRGMREFTDERDLLCHDGRRSASMPGEDVRDAVLDVLRSEGWTIDVTPDREVMTQEGRHIAYHTIRFRRAYTQCDLADALSYNATVGG